MIRKSVAVASALGSAALLAGSFGAATSSSAAASDAQSVGTSTTITDSAASAALAKPKVHKAKKHGKVVSSFSMVRSTASVKAGCLTKATAKVEVTSRGPVEVMKVWASGLPKNTDFDFFVIQVPDAPFGLAWYQGDLEANKHGKATGTFIGRFSEETFIVAPGVAAAPVEHTSPFADASTNPATAPVHTFHLGFWFNSPQDAKKAGCAPAVTPFNGDHNAGVQAMSTRQFPVLDGPLGQIKS